jgi:hypothetical protein
MIACGYHGHAVYQDDMEAVILMAVHMKRVPHPKKWVDDMVAAAQVDTFAQMFEGI